MSIISLLGMGRVVEENEKLKEENQTIKGTYFKTHKIYFQYIKLF